MKSRLSHLLFAVIVTFLSISQTTNAQFSVDWEYNLPQKVRATPLVDKDGNSYFVTWDWTTNYLNKVNSDGTTGWLITGTDSHRDIFLDGAGNIFFTYDSNSVSTGHWVHSTGYHKYSTDGTLQAQVEVQDLGAGLNGYQGSWPGERAEVSRVDFAGNVLKGGFTRVAIDNYYYGRSLLFCMNDGGLLWKDFWDGGLPDWGVDGVQIQQVDKYNEFLVRVTFKELVWDNPGYRSFLIKCSADAGIIWRKEIPYDGNKWRSAWSGAIYSVEVSPAALTKRDRTFNLQWSSPVPQNAYLSFQENPVDASVVMVNSNATIGEDAYTCLNPDGTVRWTLPDTPGGIGFDQDGNLLSRSLDATLNQYDITSGSLLSTSSSIPSGIIRPDALGNLIIVTRSKITKLVPSPSLTLKDANRDALSNTDVYLIRVADDVPLFTEDTLGIITTDIDGAIPLTPTGTTDEYEITTATGTATVNKGDRIKISKHLADVASQKHPITMPTMYSIHIDNGKFDEFGVLSFDEIMGSNQDIILDHSEFRFNVMVAVEWDAKAGYLSSVENGFRNLSNYLYDVTDGQVRLDTVMIYDNQDHWLDADMRIWANNTLWPNGSINGININNIGDVVNMPRKWYGSLDESRNESYTEGSDINCNVSVNFKQITHELGHYLFGFDEEYEFADLLGHCGAVYNYGFMEYPYDDGGEYASEMSNPSLYVAAECRNTYQYQRYLQSCWEQFETNYEDHYGVDGILAAVLTPSENGFVPFTGPNNDLSNLNYDVGAKVVFPVTVVGPSAFTLDVVTHDIMLNPLPGIDVVLRKPIIGGGWHDVYQGKSCDLNIGMTPGGGIFVLGAESGDQILASTAHTVTGIAKIGANVDSASFNWLISKAIVGGISDTVNLTLSPIEGSYPLVLQSSLTDSNEINLLFSYGTAFNSPLKLSLPDGNNYTFIETNPEYSLLIQDSLAPTGIMQFYAEDASGTPFFFNVDYIRQSIDSGSSGQLTGRGGSFVVRLDSGSTATSVFILSSPYPPLRNGLDINSVAVGETYSLALLGDSINTHLMTIHYSTNDLSAGYNSYVNEMSLAVYSWDRAGLVWRNIGGVIDSASKQVSVTIPGSGVYALFSNDVTTGVGDDIIQSELPKRFALKQNYPNPFNPSTMISYSVDKRVQVRLTILDILGRNVRTLVNEVKSSGNYTVEWDGMNNSGARVASGVYFYRLETGDEVASKKMLLLK